jgi:hypothetical protein
MKTLPIDNISSIIGFHAYLKTSIDGTLLILPSLFIFSKGMLSVAKYLNNAPKNATLPPTIKPILQPIVAKSLLKTRSTVAAPIKPKGEAISIRDVNKALFEDTCSETHVATPPHSPPTPKPCMNLKAKTAIGAINPIVEYAALVPPLS